MQHSFTRLLGRCFCFVALYAALAASSHAQVAPHSGDAGFNVGWNNAGSLQSNGTVSSTAFSYGGSTGCNLSENIESAGEFQYVPEGSYDSVSANTQLYGGLMRYSFGKGQGEARTSWLAVAVRGDRSVRHFFRPDCARERQRWLRWIRWRREHLPWERTGAYGPRSATMTCFSARQEQPPAPGCIR